MSLATVDAVPFSQIRETARRAVLHDHIATLGPARNGHSLEVRLGLAAPASKLGFFGHQA